MPSSEPPSQWLFPITALQATATLTSSKYTLEKELYDRARGVEFLFRLGSSLGLPSSAMFTAATWFHRFYMRYSMEDYHRQDVAASCMFLATKTEECGRKLRDVARVCQAKCCNVDISQIAPDSEEVEKCRAMILLTEEVLLEALCFDFVVGNPHAELLNLFEGRDDNLRNYAWSIAHDSYRTPLCILFPPSIIATACFVLGQRIAEGNLSPSLDARISATAPSSSLPTPPSNQPPSPDPSRVAIDHFGLTKDDLISVADALSILLEFYCAQDIQGSHPYLSPLVAVPPPTTASPRPRFYLPFSHATTIQTNADHNPASNVNLSQTPVSSHGGSTPTANSLNEQKGDREAAKKPSGRLDLS